MPIPSDACPGKCNSVAREVHTAYDTALPQWRNVAYYLATRPGNPDDAHDPGPAPDDWDITDDDAKALGLEPRPAKPEKTFREGAPIWCGACISSARRALAEIDRLAYTLAAHSDGHRGAASGEQISRRVAGPRTVSPIIEMLDRLYGEVTDVEDEWRQYCGYLPVRRSGVRGSHNRSTAIAFISERLDAILAEPEYTEFGHRILKWERLLMAQTKSEPVTRRRPGRCPRCRMVSVLEVGDDDITKCGECGRWMSEEEYQRDVVHGADGAVAEDTRQARAAR